MTMLNDGTSEYVYHQGINYPQVRTTGSDIVYNILDERGSVMGQVKDGQVVSKIKYSALGQRYVESQSFEDVSLPKFSYTGFYVEPYTGLQHTHYRDYDWRTHRWDREDPAGYVDGLNLYAAYFDVNGVDATGLSLEEPTKDEVLAYYPRDLDNVLYGNPSYSFDLADRRRTYSELQGLIYDKQWRSFIYGGGSGGIYQEQMRSGHLGQIKEQ
jgi:RHS repeat-associated protein